MVRDWAIRCGPERIGFGRSGMELDGTERQHSIELDMAIKNLAGLWKPKNAGSSTIGTGKLQQDLLIKAGTRIGVMPNRNKRGDSSPDFNLVEFEDDGQPYQRKEAAHKAAAADDTLDDDIPFRPMRRLDTGKSGPTPIGQIIGKDGFKNWIG